MVSVYLWVLNVVSIPKDKSESVVCTAGPLISPLPCPACKDRTRRRVSAMVPCRTIAAAAVPPIPSTLTSEIDTTIRTVITVFFKPCREPESSGRSSSSRALRFLSRPVGVEAVVAEPLTPPEVGSRTDADKTFCAISPICQALCPLVLD